MRPPLLKTVVAMLIAAATSPMTAQAEPWSGSYSAAGECYCVGELPAHVRLAIIPTPVGGQTVGQICQRLGEGPGLKRVNGLFNRPVYADAQCGHGPGIDKQAGADPSCAGSFDGVGADIASCFPKGPRWNLADAYGNPAVLAAAMPMAEAEDADEIPVAEADASSIENDSSAADVSESLPVLAVMQTLPEGAESVVIDRQRYIRARDGYPAAGGKPGQRILIDGKVYLRDDGDIEPQDIHRRDDGSLQASLTEPPEETREENAAEAPEAVSEQERVAAEESRKQEALKRQADIRATSRQIQRQRRQLREEAEAVAAEERRRRVELQQAKDRLEAASAERARRIMQERVEAQRARQSVVELTADTADGAGKAAGTTEDRSAPDMAAATPGDASVASADTSSPSSQPVAESPETAESDRQDANGAVRAASGQVTTPSSQSGVAESTAGAALDKTSVTSALRLPAGIRSSNRDFRYVEALPVSYDIGGNGVMLEGSSSSHARLQYFGRIGVANSYRELLAGGGYYLTPERADRLTVMLLAGIEYGTFELSDGNAPAIQVDYDDSGVYLAASSRMVVNKRFELTGGVSYSSLFEGDATVFGGGYLHLTRKLDLVTRFELGDNDLLGIGIRYYY